MGLLIGFARSFFGEAPATLRTFFRAVDISSVAFSTDHDETPTLQAGELARIALNFGADGSGTWRRKFDTNQYCVRPESRLTVRRSAICRWCHREVGCGEALSGLLTFVRWALQALREASVRRQENGESAAVPGISARAQNHANSSEQRQRGR